MTIVPCPLGKRRVSRGCQKQQIAFWTLLRGFQVWVHWGFQGFSQRALNQCQVFPQTTIYIWKMNFLLKGPLNQHQRFPALRQAIFEGVVWGPYLSLVHPIRLSTFVGGSLIGFEKVHLFLAALNNLTSGSKAQTAIILMIFSLLTKLCRGWSSQLKLVFGHPSWV